jgi:hypothetical protein
MTAATESLSLSDDAILVVQIFFTGITHRALNQYKNLPPVCPTEDLLAINSFGAFRAVSTWVKLTLATSNRKSGIVACRQVNLKRNREAWRGLCNGGFIDGNGL